MVQVLLRVRRMQVLHLDICTCAFVCYFCTAVRGVQLLHVCAKFVQLMTHLEWWHEPMLSVMSTERGKVGGGGGCVAIGITHSGIVLSTTTITTTLLWNLVATVVGLGLTVGCGCSLCCALYYAVEQGLQQQATLLTHFRLLEAGTLCPRSTLACTYMPQHIRK